MKAGICRHNVWRKFRNPRPECYVTLGGLRGEMGELPKDVPIVTVCGSGYRSSIAASLLQRAGFADVSTMHGGMAAWMKQSLPVER